MATRIPMVEPLTWWDETPIPGNVLAFAVFTAEAAPALEEYAGPVVGAAASGDRAALVREEQFGAFLQSHKDAILACSDATQLHWTLHDVFERRDDPHAREQLWAFSQDARLVDLKFLDMHLRRLGNPLCTAVASFHEIAARELGVELPADQELKCLVLEAFRGAGPSASDAGLQLALKLVCTLVKVYESLVAQARETLIALIGELRRLGRLPLRQSEALDDAAVCEQLIAAFGPLGVASDVQWAIAIEPATRAGLHVDMGRWNELRSWSEQRHAEASRELLGDSSARGAFRGSEGRIDLLDSGQPRTDTRKLRGWIRAVLEELCDRNNCPLPWADQPPTKPEQWGVWAAGHRFLHAWRDLTVAGRCCRAKVTDGKYFPSYNAPLLLSTAPDLAWLRSSRHRVCVPRQGQRFLVCRLQNLAVRCLAWLCQARGYAGNGRLAGYLLSTPQRDLEPFRSWLLVVASELYAAAQRADADTAGRNTVAADGGRSRMARQFVRMRRTNREEYCRWLRITRALLETLPLGLRPEHLTVLLDREYGLSMGTTDVERYANILADQVAYELKGFLDDDTLDLLADRLHRPFPEVLRSLLPGGEEEHVNTVSAHVRNELLHGPHTSPVWDMVAEARLPVQTRPDLGHCLLRRRGLSLQGRLTDETFCAQVRQQEYLLGIDEVIKAVAYALISNGYQLAAVAGPELVLEMHETGSDPALPHQVRRLIRQAQEPLLGRLAAPCRCEWRDDW